MKYFGFDKSIYKHINESLFDDTDDILSNDEDTNNISDLYIDDEYLLEKFNELYCKQNLSKYNLLEYPVFSKLETYNINGTDYKFITELSKDARYSTGSPTGIKYCSVGNYIINSQELMDFIHTYNIIIQYPYHDKYENTSYVTYIIDNINVPQDFFNNFYLYQDKNVKKKTYTYSIYSIGLILNNCKVIQDELEKILQSGDLSYLCIKYILLNKLNIKSLNLSQMIYGYPLEITNCNQLIDLNMNYNIFNYTDASLVIKNCKQLTNIQISENSKMIQLLKLKIDKCPNINTDTLILPNHNQRNYNVQLMNDKVKQRAIKFRGDIVKQFYTELHPDYKYKYLDYGPNMNMYWLK